MGCELMEWNAVKKVVCLISVCVTGCALVPSPATTKLEKFYVSEPEIVKLSDDENVAIISPLWADDFICGRDELADILGEKRLVKLNIDYSQSLYSANLSGGEDKVLDALSKKDLKQSIIAHNIKYIIIIERVFIATEEGDWHFILIGGRREFKNSAEVTAYIIGLKDIVTVTTIKARATITTSETQTLAVVRIWTFPFVTQRGRLCDELGTRLGEALLTGEPISERTDVQ